MKSCLFCTSFLPACRQAGVSRNPENLSLYDLNREWIPVSTGMTNEQNKFKSPAFRRGSLHKSRATIWFARGVNLVLSNATIRRIFVINRLIVDLTALIFSLFLAYAFRYYVQNPPFYHPLSIYYDNFAVGVMVWILLFVRSDLYKYKAQLCKYDQFFTVLGNGVLATLTIFAYMSLIKEERYARLTIIYFGAFGIFFVSFGRFLLRKLHNKLRKKGYGVRNVLIAGSGKSGEMLENKIRNHPELGYRMVKAIRSGDFNSSSNHYSEAINRLFEEIFSFAENNRIDDIIYVHARSYKEDIMKLLYFCEDRKITLTIVPNLFEIMTKKIDFTEIGNIPLMKLKERPLEKWQQYVKRIIDLALAIPGFLILFPFMVLVWICIKIDSPGPGIFKQERIGKDGKVFTMYKFRSMQVYAASLPPTRARTNDPRLTRVGRLLRKYSIDEIPQLYNVINGDMALVGPRPETALYVDQYTSWQRRRLETKPGVTGLAQVNGVRGNIDSVDERVMYDIEYIENQSISLDLKILFATLLVFPFQIKAE